MLTLTEQAKACILEKFGRDQLLRLDISPRGCGSPVVTLHPDIADKDDRQLEVDGIRILMRTSLCDTVQTVLLDAVNGRFTAKMSVPVTVDGCGRCPASPLQGGTCGIIEGKNF